MAIEYPQLDAKSRPTAHEWYEPESVVVDDTMIQLDDDQDWLYPVVNPTTNRLRHVRLFPASTTALFEPFMTEGREKKRVGDALFVVDGAPGSKRPVPSMDRDSATKPTGIATASNISSEKEYAEPASYKMVPPCRRCNRRNTTSGVRIRMEAATPNGTGLVG